MFRSFVLKLLVTANLALIVLVVVHFSGLCFWQLHKLLQDQTLKTMAAIQAEIIEGFLCPMCMKDFGTVTQLQHHFEDAHNAEDKAVFQQLKGNVSRVHIKANE